MPDLDPSKFAESRTRALQAPTSYGEARCEYIPDLQKPRGMSHSRAQTGLSVPIILCATIQRSSCSHVPAAGGGAWQQRVP